MSLNLKTASSSSAPSVKSMDVRLVRDHETAVTIRFQLSLDGVKQDPWLETCKVMDRLALDIDGEIENWVTVQQVQKVDGKPTTVYKSYRVTTA